MESSPRSASKSQNKQWGGERTHPNRYSTNATGKEEAFHMSWHGQAIIASYWVGEAILAFMPGQYWVFPGIPFYERLWVKAKLERNLSAILEGGSDHVLKGAEAGKEANTGCLLIPAVPTLSYCVGFTSHLQHLLFNRKFRPRTRCRLLKMACPIWEPLATCFCLFLTSYLS